tara:strand:- start:3269 stop:3868 length:600 start_codon:yes stop_codon:yes gene_type:complete
MKKNLILLLFLCGFAISISHVIETHSNGMPKVIKEYNSSPKLYLSKETGYYPDGTKEYENKYYKGKLKSSSRWSADGKRIIDRKTDKATYTPSEKKVEEILTDSDMDVYSIDSEILFEEGLENAIEIAPWSEVQIDELIKNCRSANGTLKECECMVELLSNTFTYSEFKLLENKSEKDMTDLEREKTDRFMRNVLECVE